MLLLDWHWGLLMFSAAEGAIHFKRRAAQTGCKAQAGAVESNIPEYWGLDFSELVGVHPSAAAYHISIMTMRTTPTHALYATASNWFAT